MPNDEQTALMDSILSYLNSDFIVMRDREGTVDKIKQLIADGPNKLQVVTDFDRTMTRYETSTGSVNRTCYGVLDHSDLLPEEYGKTARGLRDRFYPIEKDQTLDDETKLKAMEEWWTGAHTLLVQYKMRRSKLRRAVEDTQMELRGYVLDCFRLCAALEVPVLVISGGLADVIDLFLELALKKEADNSKNNGNSSNQLNGDRENNAGGALAGLHDVLKERPHLVSHEHNVEVLKHLHVVSNRLKWTAVDEEVTDEVVTGYHQPLLHTFNKALHAVENVHYFDGHGTRSNCLLLGDMPGDFDMTSNIDTITKQVSIGFLHDEQLLPKMTSLFDVVIRETRPDRDFQLLFMIIRAIEASGK